MISAIDIHLKQNHSSADTAVISAMIDHAMYPRRSHADITAYHLLLRWYFRLPKFLPEFWRSPYS